MNTAETAQARSLAFDQASEVCRRLSGVSDMVMPAHLLISLGDSPTAEDKYNYLSALLQKNPSIFLERHGKHLRPEELELFDPLSDDYEVAFYLKALHQQRKPQGSVVKNRQGRFR